MFKNKNINRVAFKPVPNLRTGFVREFETVEREGELVKVAIHKKETVPQVASGTEINSIKAWNKNAINALPLRQEKLKLDDLYPVEIAMPKNPITDKPAKVDAKKWKHLRQQKEVQETARQKRLMTSQQANKLNILRKAGVFDKELETLYLNHLDFAGVCSDCFKVLQLEKHSNVKREVYQLKPLHENQTPNDKTIIHNKKAYKPLLHKISLGSIYHEKHKAFFEIQTTFNKNIFGQVIGINKGKVKNRKAKDELICNVEKVFNIDENGQKMKSSRLTLQDGRKLSEIACTCHKSDFNVYVTNEIARFERFANEFYLFNPHSNKALELWYAKRNNFNKQVFVKDTDKKRIEFVQCKFSKDNFNQLKLALEVSHRKIINARYPAFAINEVNCFKEFAKDYYRNNPTKENALTVWNLKSDYTNAEYSEIKASLETINKRLLSNR